MLSYCLRCKRNTGSINPKVSKTINGKTMILSKCAICGSKKSTFIKEQQAKGLLSNLGIRTPLSSSTRRYYILIKYKFIKCNSLECNFIV